MSGYNGYKNYETWACNLWLNNEEGTYKYYMEAAGAALDAAGGNREKAAYILADQIKDELQEAAPDMGASLYSDLLGRALQSVDYIEVAKNFLEE